jgi:hypothetical protein
MVSKSSYYSSLLKMESVRSSETSAVAYQTKWRHISEDSIQHIMFAELTVMPLY